LIYNEQKENIMINTTRATLIALSVCFTAGCATTSQLEEVKATADNALSTAQAAQSAAADAKQAADAAQACCNENSEKLDRMFERSMRK
jgi:hypothetical protein